MIYLDVFGVNSHFKRIIKIPYTFKIVTPEYRSPMKIIKVKAPPTNADLIEVLNREFSGKYSFKLYGLGNKSVMARKSALLGAQITVWENEIRVEGAPPSFGSGFLGSLMMTELAVVLFPLFMFAGATLSKFKALEKEIAVFLRRIYNQEISD